MVQLIYTIGHSSHDFETFFSLLKRYDIELIIDIRRSPRSTRYPHFNIDRLESICSLRYSFQGDILGGRRRRRKSLGDLNNGLIDSDSHAYADHMQRKEFQQAVNDLVSGCCSSGMVLMCWVSDREGCGRLLLADCLCRVDDVQVLHILFNGETREHQVNSMAKFNEHSNTNIYPSNNSVI